MTVDTLWALWFARAQNADEMRLPPEYRRGHKVRPARAGGLNMKRHILPLIACLFVATAALAHGGAHGNANHDRVFADAMTKHHQDGIKMARLAVDKAENAELRSMARR